MAANPGEDKSAGASPAGGSSKSALITNIVSGVNLLATLGILVVLVLAYQKEQKKTSIEDLAKPGTEHEEKKEEAKSGEGHGGEHGGGHEGGHSDKKKLVNYGKMITLEQFTVNLSTPGTANSKYVRANVSLEVPGDDIETEVVSKMPQVRNTIIDLFNSKRPSDLATVDGREYLKEEIRNAINNFLVSGKVKGVYFTSFAVAG